MSSAETPLHQQHLPYPVFLHLPISRRPFNFALKLLPNSTAAGLPWPFPLVPQPPPMEALPHLVSLTTQRPPVSSSPPPPNSGSTTSRVPVFNSRALFVGAPHPLKPQYHHYRLHLSCSNQQFPEEEDRQTLVEDLRVPDSWILPSKALQESEWLRVALRKWLDDEYCPEATNADISKVAAHSFYESLIAKRTDLGEILLNLARDLESLSFQESFHGAFSSANAAVHLIALRIELTRQD